MEDDNSILDVVRTEVRVTPGCLSLLETRESSHTTVCSCWRLSHLFPSDALQSPSRNYLLNHLQLLHGIWPASSCPALSGTAHRPSAKPPKSVQSHPLPAQPARLHPSTKPHRRVTIQAYQSPLIPSSPSSGSKAFITTIAL